MKVVETTPEKTFDLHVTQTELSVIRKALNLAALVGGSSSQADTRGMIRMGESSIARDLSYTIQQVHKP